MVGPDGSELSDATMNFACEAAAAVLSRRSFPVSRSGRWWCDRPGPALLKHAEGAQLIVVGSRGRGAFAGVGLGSVSQSPLHHAQCPVVVVRKTAT